MDYLIELFASYLHDRLNNIGYIIPQESIKVLLYVLFASGIIPFLYKLTKGVFHLIVQLKAKYDLHPYIDSKEIDLATRVFIPTKGQNISPANEYEPRNSIAFTSKNKLIPIFLNAIENKNNDIKYYLILGDSGMGKSTFLINLYIRYNRLISHRKYKMLLLPLAHPDIDNLIDQISEPDKTVLLLDGFDEDPKATINYEERLKYLTKKVWKFRKIFLTSRTQFFPSEEKEPHQTHAYRHSLDGETQHYFKKIYLSPFDDKDINNYIKKKYPIYIFWKLHNRGKARKIINLCPNLMVRPMLLSYIENLIAPFSYDKSQAVRNTPISTADIYEILINQWIIREAKRIDTSRREMFMENMYKFSLDVALFLFTERRHKLSLSSDEIMVLSEKNSIKLSELELKGKSLLNRDGAGNYKFAHKSILEFFLAKHAITDTSFGEGTLYFREMEDLDQAAKFCEELMLINL